jgi:lipopolysaccharide biosynthesis glycosyltransferase
VGTNIVNVASGVDNNYVFPLLVMLNSARDNSFKDINFYLGYSGSSLSIQNRNRISKVCRMLDISVEFVELKYDLDTNISTSSHLTEVTYYRLLLADQLHQTFLWLDSDIILFKSWDSIFDQYEKIEVDIIALAVQDPIVLENSDLVKTNLALKLSGNEYFNAGVFLINPVLWRTNKLDVFWKTLISRYSEYGFKFQDQDVLNYTLRGRVKLIPADYNFIVSRNFSSNKGSPFIVHYAGALKPWHIPPYLIWRLPIETRKIYLAYYSNALKLMFRVFKKDLRTFIYLYICFQKSLNFFEVLKVVFNKLKVIKKNF